MQEIEIKNTRNGKGIFALKNFNKGQIIFEIKGKLISCDIEDDLDEKTRSNALRFDEDLYLSPSDELGDFLNHSCEPNAAVVKLKRKLLIVAIRDIEDNEEVTMDYSTIIASDDSWVMNCNCGTSNCRGEIGQFNTLPQKIKQKYLSLNMVPKYILEN